MIAHNFVIITRNIKSSARIYLVGLFALRTSVADVICDGDDMVIFSNEKDSLKKLLKSIKSYLKSELYLDLKDKATCINSRLNGLSFLGTRIYPEMIRIKPENLKRTIKRLNRREKEYYCEMITSESYIQSVQSVFGLLRQYNTLKLRKKLLGQIS